MGNLSGQDVRCPRCSKLWPLTLGTCPDDGASLSMQMAVASPVDAASLEDLGTRETRAAQLAHTLGSNVPSSERRSGPHGPAGSDLPPGTRVGEYQVEGKIGQGAMGAVYRAVHPAIGKYVAVKIMSPKLTGDPGAIERFTREARSVAAIRHPGIVDVFGFGALDDGRAYLIMEWLDGTSLGSRLGRGRLEPDEALDVLDQIARALEAAHDAGTIHRDLKPDNIFLQRVARERPIVKLLDFGLAKLAYEEGHANVTQSGQLLGTPVYMSPEQCKGKGVDHRTDVYAVGCIAYELICGRVPFDADNIAELIAAHLGETPPLPRSLRADIPPQLAELMFAMLAKDPADRPTLEHVRQTISEVRRSSAPSPWPAPVAGQWATPVPGAWQTPVPHVTAATAGGRVAPPVAVSSLTSSKAAEEPPRQSRRTLTIAIAASFAITAAIVVLAMTRSGEREKSDDTVASVAAPATPEPSIRSAVVPETPAPQVVAPDAGAEPAPVKPVAKPSVADKAVRKATPPPPAEVEKVSPPAEPIRQGALSLGAKPPCDIYIDGKPTGLRTPQREIKLDAGRHEVTLVNSDHAIRDTFYADIRPGELDKQVKDYSDRMVEKKPVDANRQTINPFERKKTP